MLSESSRLVGYAAATRLRAMSDKPERLDNDVLTTLQPGLARLMPEIAARMWKAYYAAEAGAWEMSRWQLKEMNKLFRLGNITRPKYLDDVEEYISDDIQPLMDAVAARDFGAFKVAYAEAVDRANEFHRRWKKPFIVWQLPQSAPPDLLLTPDPEPEPEAASE